MIKVIVGRNIKPDKEAESIGLLIDLRASALTRPGYITGETLKSLDDSSNIITISTWGQPGAVESLGKLQGTQGNNRQNKTLAARPGKDKCIWPGQVKV
jgi:hypothetical protein